MSPNQVDALLSTQCGPSTTIGRNIASAVAALAGLVCLIFPSLQGVPTPNVIFFGAMGLALLGPFIFNALRWRGLLRRAARAAQAAGASDGFAFMLAELGRTEGHESEYLRCGWVLVASDRLLISGRQGALGVGAGSQTRELWVADIVEVYRSEPTSMSYAALVVELASAEANLFTVTPASGSGLRGPTDDEVDAAVASIRSRMEQPPERGPSR